MQAKNLSKQILLRIIFLGLILFIAFFLYFSSKNLTQTISVFSVENVAVPLNQEQGNEGVIGLPVRLKIPVIYVDSVVVPVGLTANGAMDVAKSPAEVAWFNLGSRPGEKGTAVIAGHYDWKNNTPTVFNDLYKLGVGDKIFVDDENGATTAFVVREIKVYDKDATAPNVFSSNDGKAHLNLVSCVGNWDKLKKTYSNRLVIFTDKK